MTREQIKKAIRKRIQSNRDMAASYRNRGEEYSALARQYEQRVLEGERILELFGGQS